MAELAPVAEIDRLEDTVLTSLITQPEVTNGTVKPDRSWIDFQAALHVNAGLRRHQCGCNMRNVGDPLVRAIYGSRADKKLIFSKISGLGEVASRSEDTRHQKPQVGSGPVNRGVQYHCSALAHSCGGKSGYARPCFCCVNVRQVNSSWHA